MKLHSEYSEQPGEVRIELIPLIDVIFCILTFFILAAVTLTRQTAINVDLPRAQTGATQMRETMIVSVDPIGQIYLEQQPIARSQLQQALQDYILQSPEGIIVLYASRLTSYNDVVEVLDLLRGVGGNRVALATLPDAPGGATQAPLPEPGVPSFDPANPLDPTRVPGTTDLFPANPPANPTNPLPGLDPLPIQPGTPPTGIPPVPSPQP